MGVLRNNTRALYLDRKKRPIIKGILKIFFIIGVLWLIAMPYVSRGHFTAENSLND